jgi:hypothetical protein
VRKITPPPGFDPRIVQLVARRYTDCVIRAQPMMMMMMMMTTKTTMMMMMIIIIIIIIIILQLHYREALEVYLYRLERGAYKEYGN